MTGKNTFNEECSVGVTGKNTFNDITRENTLNESIFRGLRQETSNQSLLPLNTDKLKQSHSDVHTTAHVSNRNKLFIIDHKINDSSVHEKEGTLIDSSGINHNSCVKSNKVIARNYNIGTMKHNQEENIARALRVSANSIYDINTAPDIGSSQPWPEVDLDQRNAKITTNGTVSQMTGTFIAIYIICKTISVKLVSYVTPVMIARHTLMKNISSMFESKHEFY